MKIRRERRREYDDRDDDSGALLLYGHVLLHVFYVLRKKRSDAPGPFDMR
jgi:hypothetical protein